MNLVVNEPIRAILFLFFLAKRFYTHKKPKKPKKMFFKGQRKGVLAINGLMQFSQSKHQNISKQSIRNCHFITIDLVPLYLQKIRTNIIQSVFFLICLQLQFIIRSLSDHYQIIIRSLSDHYQFIIRSLSDHYQIIISSLSDLTQFARGKSRRNYEEEKNYPFFNSFPILLSLFFHQILKHRKLFCLNT